MTVTMKPVLDALGYSTPTQQRAVVRLMQAAGAFGDVPGVDGLLTDKQADAILNNVTFNDLAQAADVLHNATQDAMIRRPKGVERADCDEPEAFRRKREGLMQALQEAGMTDAVKPRQKYYDHVVVLGATEHEVDKRLDHLRELWDQGVRFGKIHLLGSERSLRQGDEPSQGKRGENGHTTRSEMDMMENRYYAKAAGWPKEMQAVRVFEVNTYNKPNGERANTKDTIESWVKTHPAKGDVLVISSQPHVRYQDAAVKSALPKGYSVDSVGPDAPYDMKVSVGMDSIARQVDVGFGQLKERLKMRKPRLETQLVLIDPKDILVDAPTYQFRSGGDKNGVTAKGKFHADRWDPVLHGDPILVHERLDGRVFVADGHHRVGLAKELNEKGAGPGKMAALVLREADGYSAKDVKIIAAYKNIAHGKTDVVDTARVFKEAYAGEIDISKLPHLQMDKGNLRMAFTLASLSDTSLDAVAKGEISPEQGEMLAKRAPGDASRQGQVLAILRQKLQQAYPKEEVAKPSQVHVHIYNFNSEAAAKATPAGFKERLARQRAASKADIHLAI